MHFSRRLIRTAVVTTHVQRGDNHVFTVFRIALKTARNAHQNETAYKRTFRRARSLAVRSPEWSTRFFALLSSANNEHVARLCARVHTFVFLPSEWSSRKRDRTDHRPPLDRLAPVFGQNHCVLLRFWKITPKHCGYWRVRRPRHGNVRRAFIIPVARSVRRDGVRQLIPSVLRFTDTCHFQKLSDTNNTTEFDFHWNSIPKDIGE